MRRHLLILWLSLLLGINPSSSLATTVLPWPWPYQVAHAGFIGLVRCEVGGLISAKYRVIESWKGPPVGSLLTIDQTLDFWSPYTPYVLVGEEFLICAYTRTPHSSLRWCSGGLQCGQPYWWRESRAQLYTSLATPPVRFPVKNVRAMGRFGMWGGSWKAYRESVLTFTREPIQNQEARGLRLEARSELRTATRDSVRTDFQRAGSILIPRVDSLDVDALVAALLTLARDHPKEGRNSVERILTTMGGERTLAGLRTPDGLEAFPGDTALYRHPIRRILARLHPETIPIPSRVPTMLLSPDSALFVNRRALKAQETGWLHAFLWLTDHDPESVVEFFEQQTVPAPGRWTHPNAYNLSSYFGWRSGGDRSRWFERLLTARDPVVRVAGAVYLTYEDSLRGVRALRDLTSLAGFPGGWAAVVLASLGEKDVMPRALELFDLPRSNHEYSHETALKARLLVLLSNSASASRLTQPPLSPSLLYDHDKKRGKAIKNLNKWWSKAEETIRLSDPWRPTWAAQRVD